MYIRLNVQVQVVRQPSGPRKIRKPRRLPVLTVIGLVALLLFVPFAFAADIFTDVPASHPFHDQIERAYTAGMIGACAGSPPPPNQTFCPGNTITKGSAANQYDKMFGLDGTPRPFTPTWRAINIITGGSVAPFTVDSQVKVDNLNADLLDGMNAADFATKSELSTPGTINTPGNPVDWTNLKNVPPGFADGTDDTGSATYNAGNGLTLTGNTFSADFGAGHNQVARGDHDHYGQSWSGTGYQGFKVTNTVTNGLCGTAAIVGVGGSPSGATPCFSTGVFGNSNAGYGVAGDSETGSGVKATSGSGTGLEAGSSTGYAGQFFGKVQMYGGSAHQGLNVTNAGDGQCGTAAIVGVGGSPAGFTPCFNTGVFGDSNAGYGVAGFSQSGAGVKATSNSGAAVEATSTNGQAGLFFGKVQVYGPIRWGSETGTTQPPSVTASGGYTGIVARRINSTAASAGQIVARTDEVRLERDGTNGGFRLAWDATSSFHETVVCMGMTNTGAAANVVHDFPANSAGTLQLYTDAQGVVYMHCMFGSPFLDSHQTEVTLDREGDDYFWTGFLTSTFNQ